MVEIYEPEDDDVEDEDVAVDLNPDAAPEPVGVYERPASTGPSMAVIVAIIAILLLLVLVLFLIL